MEEVHRLGVAAVLAADAELQVRAGRAALLDGDPDQLADALDVERLERARPRRCPSPGSWRRTRPRRRPGRSPRWSGSGRWCRRRRTRRPRRLVRGQRRPGQLDHRADRIVSSTPVSSATSRAPARRRRGPSRAPGRADQRDHDLRLRVLARFISCGGGLGDGPDLQREQARDDQPEPDAAQPQHRVLLVQPVDGLQAAAGRSRASPAASASATRTDSSVMSGRNSCSGGSSSRTVTGRPSIALRICDEVLALQRQQRVQRVLPLARRSRPGSAARRALGARRGTCARCGTGRCPRHRSGGPARRRRGCRHWPAPEPADRVGVGHEPVHGLDQLVTGPSAVGSSRPSKYSTTGEPRPGPPEVDRAGGAVDGDDVALVDLDAAGRGMNRRLVSRRARRRRRRRSCPCPGRPRRRARSCRRGR